MFNPARSRQERITDPLTQRQWGDRLPCVCPYSLYDAFLFTIALWVVHFIGNELSCETHAKYHTMVIREIDISLSGELSKDSKESCDLLTEPLVSKRLYFLLVCKIVCGHDNRDMCVTMRSEREITHGNEWTV